MSDPLGLINSGLNRVNPGLAHSGAAPATPNANQPSFKDMLMDNLREVNKLQQEATTAIEDLQTGRRTDVEGVVAATNKADVAFRTLLAVRNKVAQAYEEVKQMRA